MVLYRERGKTHRYSSKKKPSGRIDKKETSVRLLYLRIILTMPEKKYEGNQDLK